MKKTGDMHQTRYIKGPVTLCIFFSNLSRNVVARQIAGELHSVTWVVSQCFCCAKRCTKWNSALLFAMDCSNWQHHCTVYNSSSNLSRNFTTVLTGTHAHASCFSFRGTLRDKLPRKLHTVTQPQHQTSATCNATFSTLRDKLLRKLRSVTGP